MKTLTKSFASAALIFAMAAPASAEVSPDLCDAVRYAGGTASNVRIEVDGDTVTLRGYVETSHELQKIEAAARQHGATKVNNYVLRSR